MSGQHYGGARGCGYDNLKIMIIEQVEHGDSELLGRREIYWQTQLRCFIENGGKAQCKKKGNVTIQLLNQSILKTNILLGTVISTLCFISAQNHS